MTAITPPRWLLLLLAGLLALVASLSMAATQITAASGLAAPPAYSVSGRVSVTGNPVADVMITATGGYTTTTADDGTFVLANLPAGTYTITPTNSGTEGRFEPPSRTVAVPPNAANQDFRFYPKVVDYAIYGSVQTSSGAPIEGVEIVVDGGTIARTGSNGAYTFWASPGQAYRVEPRKPGYQFTPAARNATIANNPINFVGQALSRVYMPIVRLPCPSDFCGSVVIENGGVCCIGGRPGATVQIPVSFRAVSASGAVSDMRIDNGLCSSVEPINAVWEPFDTQKVYTRTLPPGWGTFDVRVQYRDEAGFVSKVYCAEVTLEGF